MTKSEHAAALALGLEIERGMTCWRIGHSGRSCHGPSLVRMVGDDWHLHDESGTWAGRHLAPDLADRATYLLALAQMCKRFDSGWSWLDEDWPDSLAGLILEPDPARLAKLLTETAP